MAFLAELGVFITTVLVLILVPRASSINNTDHSCPPSSCGNIPNIRYPFRLKGDPPKCGDQRYELSCDDNNHTLLSLHGSKYYVNQINYSDYTIRIVDSGIQENNYSFIPRYFLNYGNLSWPIWDLAPIYGTPHSPVLTKPLQSEVVVIVNCEKSVTLASSIYQVSTNCSDINNKSGSSSNSSFSQYSKRYIYLIVGYGAKVMDVEESCTIEQTSLILWPGAIIRITNNSTCTDLRNLFSYGFVLSWYPIYCGSCSKYEFCYIDVDDNQVHCAEWHVAISVLGAPFVIAFLIYKWQRRHLSMYDNIEEFLQTQNNLMPIRYSFSEIKKMTKGFKETLGEGGFGTVFKGTLRSGHLVAVKMLSQSKANGQDFINEVATIGRIHHVNIVQLIGFCVHGSKRALIYEFMPNGSLNKHIFSLEANILNYVKTHDIALGVARGIEYLHQGCDMQILHFDIKPHNILLDENLKPKVSDFGLAKLYPVEDSIVHLTGARGTLGYMAPEILYKNIGDVSYKADVYSFGMLLMEMVSRRKNLDPFTEHLSQIYFPTWIYDQFHDGKNIEIQDATEDERIICKKMMIVALWCIQLKPSDRPSMNKVVKMLEGDVECLQVPLKPLQPSPKREIKGARDNSNQASSSIQSDESNRI
ncbi:hypothetical protein I3842_08G129700 [Carya illinoinensis]|uniref:Protein kinase domain-containing protein n=1 Tax=Carya illinoinensis TaxID=32201 RepID=A0A922JDT8_CARIL|nr:hypothetical protein I3842_08G129700 [Carya illinoinensis]